jgi:hypothetical protein
LCLESVCKGNIPWIYRPWRLSFTGTEQVILGLFNVIFLITCYIALNGRITVNDKLGYGKQLWPVLWYRRWDCGKPWKPQSNR